LKLKWSESPIAVRCEAVPGFSNDGTPVSCFRRPPTKELKYGLKAIYSWNTSPKHALAMNWHILVSRFDYFCHLASLVWAKLILGRFRDAVLPDYSRFPADSDDYLNLFSLIPVMGDIVVDMSQA
jgi:hypothetical protein